MVIELKGDNLSQYISENKLVVYFPSRHSRQDKNFNINSQYHYEASTLILHMAMHYSVTYIRTITRT